MGSGGGVWRGVGGGGRGFSLSLLLKHMSSLEPATPPSNHIHYP